MSEQSLCPSCENGITEQLGPRRIAVGAINGEVWVCKACASRAVEHIGFAAHLLMEAIQATVQQRRAASLQQGFFNERPFVNEF
jgi:hypothetical protein